MWDSSYFIIFISWWRPCRTIFFTSHHLSLFCHYLLIITYGSLWAGFQLFYMAPHTICNYIYLPIYYLYRVCTNIHICMYLVSTQSSRLVVLCGTVNCRVHRPPLELEIRNMKHVCGTACVLRPFCNLHEFHFHIVCRLCILVCINNWLLQ